MKKVTVVGAGLGPGTLTADALAAIERADILLGAPGVLKPYRDTAKPLYPYYLPTDVAALVASQSALEFALLVSGDTGFYSAAKGLRGALPGCELKFIPGISTVNAFFASLGLPWQHAALISAHGRSANTVDTVRRNRLTFCLTGGNVAEIGAAMQKAGLGQIKVHVGENLKAEHERIYELTAADLAGGDYPPLTVLLFENPDFDDSTPCGIPDERFIRQKGIPMTKCEVRAVAVSKLHIRPGFVCWDIGAGSGSVTVEMALAAYKGHVYAIDRSDDAVKLTERNCDTFRLGNVTALCAQSPGALEGLPCPDCVFIGGSGGELGRAVSAALNKNDKARIVITAVTPQTVSGALEAFANAGLTPALVQINAARGKPVGGLHLMQAQNPVTILSAGGENEAIANFGYKQRLR